MNLQRLSCPEDQSIVHSQRPTALASKGSQMLVKFVRLTTMESGLSQTTLIMWMRVEEGRGGCRQIEWMDTKARRHHRQIQSTRADDCKYHNPNLLNVFAVRCREGPELMSEPLKLL